MKKVSNVDVIYEFSRGNKPVVAIEPGERVVFDTQDALGGQIQSEEDTMGGIDFSKVNPATGPVYVKTASPGDALVIQVEEISLGQKGIMLAVPGLGILGDKVRVSTTKIVPVVEGKVMFSSNIVLAVSPMIGVIGVAPASGAASCGTPGDHGGNMDTRDIRQGVKLFLPVFVEGGLLAIGDVHAAMADGETCGTGVEITASVKVVVDVIKRLPLKRPIVETGESFIFIGSAENLEKAVRIAVEDASRALSKSLKIPFEEAYMLLSLVGSVKVSQMVDPARTARVEISKDILKELMI